MERIVTEHFEEYYDRSIRDEYLEYEKEAHRRKREANNYTSKFEGRIKDVRARINDVVTPYKEKIDQLQEELALELESHRDAFFALEKEVMKAAYEALPELPDVPEAHEPDVEESDNVLFDSTRDYFEQTKILRGAKVAKPPKTRKKRSKKAVASSE